MMHDSSRSRFIRGDLKGVGNPIRPPWTIAETRFLDQCTRCNDCISACPKQIIKTGPGQYPIVDFTHNGCDFCQLCVQACKTGALCIDQSEDSAPWSIQASFLKECLSMNGVVCRSCSEVCPTRAIRFSLKPGGSAQPLLIAEQCNGCGECLAVCPVKSIDFSNNSVRAQVA
ncbi:MAG: ferredoxin-type protein NapF [Sedimenticola sp.]|jgi:ferredoxin-type protein NapF|nr:MAG: ferredoxin-type protein NapF [Sedimenticola sp.]